MEERLEKLGYYRTLDMFVADMLRITENCRLYNNEDTPYVKCASKLENFFKARLHQRAPGSVSFSQK